MPIEALEGLVTVNQHPSNNQNNQKVFEINIRLVAPVPEEENAEDSDESLGAE